MKIFGAAVLLLFLNLGFVVTESFTSTTSASPNGHLNSTNGKTQGNLQRPQRGSPSQLQSTFQSALETRFRNASNESVLHAHLHKDKIFKTSHIIEDVALSESEYFIQKIFHKYGSQMSLSFKGLRELMFHLGLTHSVQTVETTVKLGDLNVKDGKRSMVGYESPHEKDGQRRDVKKRSVESVVITHNHGDHSECHPLSDLLSAFHFDHLTNLDPDQFLFLCPALIDQLDNSGCHHHHGNHPTQTSDQLSDDPASTHHDDHFDDDDSSDDTEISVKVSRQSEGFPALVWAYSIGAVTVISLVGLLGVAAIPIIRRVFYKSLLQFLIALAVGALSGDALLHLLPHALSPPHEKHEATEPDGAGNHTNTTHSHNHHKHNEGGEDHSALVWKGLVALLGLVFFFLAERILTIVTSKRASLKAKRKAKKKAELLEMSSSDATDHVIVVPPTGPGQESFIRETAILSDHDDENGDDSNQRFLDDHDHQHPTENGHGHHHGEEGRAQGHGHGHGHGEVPGSVSAVALMVIFGDGIHNFSDGLAIGAAFANSVTGGLSTTIAVFCHELPHEIGDFAMLLSEGMSWKQAMLYNVLSSVLCLLGMVVGIFLGYLDNAVTWIFCGVAGMFLYISLADMLPQLKSASEKPGHQLLMQCLGIGIGSGIMLLIAVYEQDLKTLLD